MNSNFWQQWSRNVQFPRTARRRRQVAAMPLAAETCESRVLLSASAFVAPMVHHAQQVGGNIQQNAKPATSGVAQPIKTAVQTVTLTRANLVSSAVAANPPVVVNSQLQLSIAVNQNTTAGGTSNAVVSIEDSNGNVVTSSSATIELSVTSTRGGSHSTSQNAAGGEATFSGLNLTGETTTYDLRASIVVNGRVTASTVVSVRDGVVTQLGQSTPPRYL